MLRTRLAGSTLKSLAGDLDVSIGYLHDILNERREPGPKMLKALKLKRRVIYEPINGRGKS
jgi:transcriptional regulator with XRE-family HTH domain